MALDTFNKRSRPSIFRNLADENFDLLVIGGGITGASVFRDAALRGMKVALVEAKDFASATSGRSSKLIHGGLRYIKNLGLGLAWESCHERNLHVRLNKRLVRPLPFLVPLYRKRGESRRLMRLGMLLYEALSGFNNHPFHRFLSREETLSLAPALPAHELTGGCLYYDAVINDSRWTMEVLKDGVAHSGVAVNYAPVTELLNQNMRTTGARVYDELSGTHYDVRARVVVSATGIFSDQIRRLDGDRTSKPQRLSKGTHLVFAEADVPLSTTIVFSSPLDGRSLFLAKHEECFLYGTSDHWEEANPNLPIPARTDVDYLLSSLNRFMPEAQLDRSKVQFVYSGFRPLFANGDQRIQRQ
jgi:glycerol-3-phosphate dehydrogenase